MNEIIREREKININGDIQNIDWHILKEKFKKNEIKPDILKQVGNLRREKIDEILSELNINKSCYYEFGLTDLTSDIDFTYVDFNNPKKNVENLKKYIWKLSRWSI